MVQSSYQEQQPWFKSWGGVGWGETHTYSMAISQADLLSPYFTFNRRVGQYYPINFYPIGTGWDGGEGGIYTFSP